MGLTVVIIINDMKEAKRVKINIWMSSILTAKVGDSEKKPEREEAVIQGKKCWYVSKMW